MEDELENPRLFRVGSGSRSLRNLRPIDDPDGSFTLNGQEAMKDQDWTWKQIATCRWPCVRDDRRCHYHVVDCVEQPRSIAMTTSRRKASEDHRREVIALANDDYRAV